MQLTLEEVAYRVLPRVEPGRALAPSEWRTLVAAAEVLLHGSPVHIAPERVADNVERFLINGRSRRAWRCRVLFTVLELMPLAKWGRRFSELDRATRSQLVRDELMEPRHLWRICAKVRYLVIMGTYGDEVAERPTGFVPIRLRPRFRRSERRDAPVVEAVGLAVAEGA